MEFVLKVSCILAMGCLAPVALYFMVIEAKEVFDNMFKHLDVPIPVRVLTAAGMTFILVSLALGVLVVVINTLA